MSPVDSSSLLNATCSPLCGFHMVVDTVLESSTALKLLPTYPGERSFHVLYGLAAAINEDESAEPYVPMADYRFLSDDEQVSRVSRVSSEW